MTFDGKVSNYFIELVYFIFYSTGKYKVNELKNKTITNNQQEMDPENSDANFILYLITCIVNEKEYVGVTTGSIEKRWELHVSSALSKKKKKELSTI